MFNRQMTLAVITDGLTLSRQKQWRNYVGSALRQTFPRRPTDFSERELTFMYARPSVVCLSVVCNVRAPYSVG